MSYANPLFLTLASSSATTNLLPVLLDKQWMTNNGSQWCHNWNKAQVSNVERFTIEYASDGVTFKSIAALPATQGQTWYKQAIPIMYSSGYSRIRVCFVNGHCETAPELRFGSNDSKNKLEVRHTPGDRWLAISTERNQEIALSLSDRMGATIEQQKIRLSAGLHRYPLRSLHVQPGIYFLTLTDFKGRRKTLALIF